MGVKYDPYLGIYHFKMTLQIISTKDARPVMKRDLLGNHYLFYDKGSPKAKVTFLRSEKGLQSHKTGNTLELIGCAHLANDPGVNNMVGLGWTHIYAASTTDNVIVESFKAGTLIFVVFY